MTATIDFKTPSEKIEAYSVGDKLAYNARLFAALGNGADWEYRGECYDLEKPVGKCSCGHAIRYVFNLHNKKTEAIKPVGNVCIDNFNGLNEAVLLAIRADLERLELAAAERVKAAKRAAEDAKVKAALEVFDAKAWELDRVLAAGAKKHEMHRWNFETKKEDSWTYWTNERRTSYTVWRNWHNPATAAERLANREEGKPYPRKWKLYKTPVGFRKHIEDLIKKIDYMIAHPWEENDGR